MNTKGLTGGLNTSGTQKFTDRPPSCDMLITIFDFDWALNQYEDDRIVFQEMRYSQEERKSRKMKHNQATQNRNILAIMPLEELPDG